MVFLKVIHKNGKTYNLIVVGKENPETKKMEFVSDFLTNKQADALKAAHILVKETGI